MPITSEGNLRRGLFEVLREAMRLRNYSPRTIKSYASCIRQFVDHIAPHYPKDTKSQS